MDDQQLLARIEMLEQSNRRMRRLGTAGLAAAGALGLLSMAAPILCKTVRAERFELTDARGAARVTFDAYSSRDPKITVRDRSGEPVADLTLGLEGGIDLSLFHGNGPPVKAQLVFDADGTPHFGARPKAKDDGSKASACDDKPKLEKSIN